MLHRFGPRSEKIDPDQLALMLEDVEQSIAAGEAEAEAQEFHRSRSKQAPAASQAADSIAARCPSDSAARGRGHRPRRQELPPCPCGGLRIKIGEDASERLDMIPARFRVSFVTRRPKYACRACEGEVAQAPAPERLDRKRRSDRGPGRGGRHRQICRPSTTLPAGSDLRAAKASNSTARRWRIGRAAPPAFRASPRA